ncbi:MAG: protein kinase domain-containing protein [Myxococcales bacterium]
MERFGKYQLIRKLATGGMAEIYLARSEGLEGFQKQLVVKRILPHLAENEEFVEMFLHEARIAVRLNHPNVVQIYDLGRADGSYFIAMEYIAGDDVRRIWKRADAAGTPIPIPLACRIVADAAAGLDYAHKRTDASGSPLNIIHRDVSPQNILVSYEGAVKVVDFGIAKAADQATVTRSGVLKGKYSYMSPEQGAGKDIDHRTDQFALGVVLYELLTCTRLFKRQNEIQTLAAVTECRIPPPSAANPRVPKELDPIVMRALARERRDRYPDLRGLQSALEEWMVATRQPATTSALAAFMGTLYADRAEQERNALLAEEGSGSESESRHDGLSAARRRTGMSRAADGPGATRNGRTRRPGISDPRNREAGAAEPSSPSEQRVTRKPRRELDASDVPEGTITGSSVSRLVNRLSARKKAAIGLAVATGLAGVAGVFVYQQQVNSTTARPPIVEVLEHDPRIDPQLAVRYGGLRITTDPPGATVLVDARPVEGRTPLTVGTLSLGEHQIFAELPGYEPAQQTVRLEREGDVQPVQLTLHRIGEEPVAAADPLRAPETKIADRLRDPVRRDERTDKPDKTPRKVAVAPRTGEGTLSIESDPVVTVWQGSQELGKTPLQLKLPAGPHQLVLVNQELGLEQSVNATVRADETEQLRRTFKTGEVLFLVKPWADVYLRKRRIGQTPFPKIRLIEGEHTFHLVNEDLKKTKKVTVMVKAGELSKVNEDLTE